MDNALILIAEDEPEISNIIAVYLERAGFRTVTATDGILALTQFRILKPDAILLDIKMPKRDGIDVLRDIRQTSDTPAIMITAMAEDLEKISALRLGADDYIVKPFNPLEVVERVKALLRRNQGQAGPERTIIIGPLIVDTSAHAAFIRHGNECQSLDLTQSEFAIISHMAKAPRRAYSRSELVDACLPEGEALERTIDSHISNARRKLHSGGAPGFLETVRSVGYRLEPLK